MNLSKKITLLTLLLTTTLVHAQVAYYPFDGNADDQIAGNNAIVNGAVLVSDRNGNPNSAYLFDGIDDYMEVTNPTPFNFGTEEFAICFWTKPLDSSQNFQMIFQKGDSGGFLPQYWLRLNDLIGGTTLRALWGDGNPPVPFIDYSSNSLLFDGNWHHIVFQRTSQNNELYIDNVLVGSDSDINRDVSSVGSLYIGAQHSNPPTSFDIYNHYTGLIDDFAIFDRSFNTVKAVDSLCLGLFTNTVLPSDSQELLIEVYPIPATDLLQIDYSAKKISDLHIEVISIEGRVLIQQQIEHPKTSDKFELDISSLASGYYYLRVFDTENAPHTKPFIKVD